MATEAQTAAITAFTATPYKVSTITCNARLGSPSIRINLQSFFDTVNLIDVSCPTNGIVWVDYIGQCRGVYPKKKKKPSTEENSKKKKKSFDNQVTIVYKLPGYYPNIKIFGNAAVHMTGIRTIEDGNMIIKSLAEDLRLLGELVTVPVADIQASDFIIRMINSGFSVPFKIRRKNLHQLLIGRKYSNICSFQPLTYPGVKLEYYWNSEYPNNKGSCLCKGNCFGKGHGHGEGNCKKVTVAIFESGQLLITGANAFCQIDAAYEYICDVIRNNVEEVRKVMPPLPNTA